MSDNSTSYAVLLVVVSLLVFLVCRELVCWYFKLNEIRWLLKQIRDRLPPPAGGTNAEPIAALHGDPRLADAFERSIDNVRAAWRQRPGVVAAVGIAVVLGLIVLAAVMR